MGEKPDPAVPDQSQPAVVSEATPSITPLYKAQHAARYERQAKIREYEQVHHCRLVVFMDAIFRTSVTYFEELLVDVDAKQDLHLLLFSPGGDGEIAVRLLRTAHSHCKKLIVVIPDQAKSAATLVALGAHEIVMGPPSDLGPIDPQMQIPGKTGLVAAKDIIAAVDDAATKVQASPDTYPLYAALLGDVTGLLVQQGRSALGRSEDLLKLSLESCSSRTAAQVDALFGPLKTVLIDQAKTHASVFGAKEAIATGLPVKNLGPADPHWKMIWTLWTYYFHLNVRVYESSRASQVVSPR
jgi:hypothetical protein